jgi:hypothetical protein
VSVGAIAASLALPTASAAQLRLQVTPYFTAYFPLRTFFEEEVQTPRVTLRDKQSNAPGVGAKLTAWANPQFGIEADVNYTKSGVVELRDPGDSLAYVFLNPYGNQIVATARLVFRPRRSNLVLGLGGGYMQRGGEAWDESRYTAGVRFNKGNFTTVASFGFFANVAPRFALLTSVEALLYSVEKIDLSRVTIPNPYDTKKFQADILLKVGVPFGGR